MQNSRFLTARSGLVLLLVGALIGGTAVGPAVPKTAAFMSVTLRLDVKGAGAVTDVTDANRTNCTSPPTTPSGSVGKRCEVEYGWGWFVELKATPAPGYQFAGWKGWDTPNAAHCDGADADHFLASGNCRFHIWHQIDLEARFVDTTPPETTIKSGPPPLTNSTSATFFLAHDGTASSFACSRDGAPFGYCSSGVPVT